MVSETHWSGLSQDEVDELARKVMRIVCEEMPSLQNKLTSSAIYDRLIEEGVELPDYAMHDALELVKPLVRFFLGGPQNPYVDTEVVRKHGGITIVSITDPDLCDEF